MAFTDFHQTIEQYIDESDMFYFVVVDAATQLRQLDDFGYGRPFNLTSTATTLTRGQKYRKSYHTGGYVVISQNPIFF